MASLIAGKPSVCVSTQTVDFAAAGLNASNIFIVYLVDNPVKSWVPGRDINGINGFEEGKGYYVIPKIDYELNNVIPPLPSEAPFDLMTFSGLQAFYDLTDPLNVVTSSGRATQIKDISGNNRHISEQFDVSIAYPTYSSSGGLGDAGYASFDVNTSMLNSSTGISGPISCYAVLRFKNFTRTDVSGQGTLKSAINFGARSNGLVMDDSFTTGNYIPKVQSGGTVFSDLYENLKKTNWQILNMDFLGRTKTRLNNQPPGLTYTVDLGTIGAGAIWLGYYTLSVEFDLAALIIVNGTIDTATEKNIYAWVDAKYPVTKNQFLEVYGDSISTGNGDNQLIWPWLVTANKGFDLVSNSQGGTVGYQNGNLTSGVPGSNFVDKKGYSFERPYAGQWIVFAFGTNDANQSLVDANWKTGFKGYIQEFIDYGYDISKMILVKAPTTTARQSVMALVFTYMDQIASELGGLHVYDCNARFAANGGDSLFADALHPTLAGQAVYADGLNLIIS